MTLPPEIPTPPDHEAWATSGPQLEPPPFVDWATLKRVSDQLYIAIRQLETKTDSIDARVRALEQAP